MQHKEITITLSSESDLTEVICKAFDTCKHGTDKRHQHVTIKPSLKQEIAELQEGESAYLAAAWRSQIGVMLG